VAEEREAHVIGPAPMCMDCERFDDGGRTRLSCEEFPDGIPDEIIDNEKDHRVPVPFDRGRRFKPKPGVEPREWWPDERGDRS
jgi:hypothetical protein